MCQSGSRLSKVIQNITKTMVCVGSVRPSSENLASWSGVRIPSIVEEGASWVHSCQCSSTSAPGPSSLQTSTGKTKKRKVIRNPVKLPRRFESASSTKTFCKNLQFKIQVSVQCWTASNPTENHGEVDETGAPLLFSPRNCHE